jgi:hypothetical protein
MSTTDDKKVASSSSMIKFSVQGILFVLKEETIMRHDWLLSKVVTSQIPWEAAADGQIFLDIDPTSFRLILSILGGVMSLATDARNLAHSELVLLKCTARYLMLDSLEKQINETLTGFEGILKQKDETIAELKREKAQLEQGKTTLEKQNNETLTEFEDIVKQKEATIAGLKREKAKLEQGKTTLDNIAEHLATMQMQAVSCRAYMDHRGYSGECGCTAIVIGNLSISEGESEDIVTCGECANDRSSRRDRQQFETYFSNHVCTVDNLEEWLRRSVDQRR